jgi:hypothetical protein
MPLEVIYMSILGPIFIAAPHLAFPELNGADISLERVARHLSSHAQWVDIVAAQVVRRYRNAELESETAIPSHPRSKRWAALRALCFRSHFLHERFNTPQIAATIRRLCLSNDYAMQMASFWTTYPMLPSSSGKQLRTIWTHNDEFKIYADHIRNTRNPLFKAVAASSLRWLRREVPKIALESVFLHVSEADFEGVNREVPGHRHLVVAVGTDLDSVHEWPESNPDGPVILSLTAALSVKMAFDALIHFRDHFEAPLRHAFGGRLVVRIIGSSPTPQVRGLCATQGWDLRPDTTNDVFAALVRESTFTMLPFPYSNGIKLKLIRTLGSGVPFLSTLACRPPNFSTPAGCCFADDPAEWVTTIRKWLSAPNKGELRSSLLNLACEYSWPKVVGDMALALEKIQYPV